MHIEVLPGGLPDALRSGGVTRGDFVGIAVASNGAALAHANTAWTAGPGFLAAIEAVEREVRPRWVWWNNDTATELIRGGVRVATAWDVAAVHRLLFGGWKAEPARCWAALAGLSTSSIPEMGQMGLLDVLADEGTDPENPVRPDGHLRPEWVSGGWAASPARIARWAATALEACGLQRQQLTALPHPAAADTTARSESTAELLCAELAIDGLPINIARVEALIEASAGPRPKDEAAYIEAREQRDALVLAHVPRGRRYDLRNPADVRSMLVAIGVDVTDTRAWRLEPFRGAHPLVDALLTWRKAERVATTYGYSWLDQHVGADGRLRGAWSGSDGAAGRMTAQAGLHNLPAEMRVAVEAGPGHVFVHADLGQIEPRVLAAVSGDRALIAATEADDLYAPVAARLRVERPIAKVAVLAAMYGQTSGAAGEALKGMESAYPVAISFLKTADRAGQAGHDLRTYGGRLVRMWSAPTGEGGRDERSAAAARGRYARNAMIQGAAAELFKAWAAIVRARATPFGGRIVLCLHDELLVHVPTEHGAEVAATLGRALQEASARWMPETTVRFVADATVIDCWSEAKG